MPAMLPHFSALLDLRDIYPEISGEIAMAYSLLLITVNTLRSVDKRMLVKGIDGVICIPMWREKEIDKKLIEEEMWKIDAVESNHEHEINLINGAPSKFSFSMVAQLFNVETNWLRKLIAAKCGLGLHPSTKVLMYEVTRTGCK